MLYPKYQKYTNRIDENTKVVPTDWEEFVKLTTIKSGGNMTIFHPYPYQKIISQLMDQYNNIICVKSRQLGITQIILSKFLHRACLNPAYSAMAFLRNADDASAISRRARQMLLGLTDYVISDSNNVGYLKLKMLGEIYFMNSSREGSRSYEVIDSLFDEAAFSERIEQIYAASSPSGALAGDNITKLIISTPSAKFGWYWNKLNADNGNIDIEQLCDDVASGKLYKEIPGLYWFVDLVGTVKVIVHWKAHPVYSQNPNYLEYRLQQDGTDLETISREYDLKFIDYSTSVFTTESVRSNAIGELEKERDKSAEYYAGVDTSTVGTDYTVCSILKCKNGIYSLVALYKKRQETSEYHLFQISELLKIYKPNICTVEVTGGTGRVYLEQLQKLFPDLHFRSFNTTADSKQGLVSLLQLALEKGILNYHPKSPIIDELLSFRRNGKRLEASSGKNDDTILATAFALWNSPENESKMPLFDISKIQIIDEIDYSDVRNEYDN